MVMDLSSEEESSDDELMVGLNLGSKMKFQKAESPKPKDSTMPKDDVESQRKGMEYFENI